MLWQLLGGVNLKIYPKSENELLFLYALVFPYIFLLFDCFEWALIDHIVKCKVHLVLWQFQGGGVNLQIYLGKSEHELLFLYALVFPYIFLLFDCFKWALIDDMVKCKVHSVLWQFQLGGVNLKMISYFSLHWYFLIYSYYLTVSNGLSLTVLKGVEVSQCSGSFKWGRGVNWQIYPKSAFLSSLAISCFASQKVFSYYIQKT